MSKVIELKTAQVIAPVVNDAVVELLDRLLTQARDGKITGVAVCYMNVDRTVSTAMEVREDRFAMGHAIHALDFRFMQIMQEDAYEPKEEGL